MTSKTPLSRYSNTSTVGQKAISKIRNTSRDSQTINESKYETGGKLRIF